MSLDITDFKSTLIQVMAWCRQATSHYLNQCWPRSMLPYGVTGSQWSNSLLRTSHAIYQPCNHVWGEYIYFCPFESRISTDSTEVSLRHLGWRHAARQVVGSRARAQLLNEGKRQEEQGRVSRSLTTEGDTKIEKAWECTADRNRHH